MDAHPYRPLVVEVETNDAKRRRLTMEYCNTQMLNAAHWTAEQRAKCDRRLAAIRAELLELDRA